MKTYTGGCHCGAVRYEVQLELEELTACNCSICSKTGWLLAFTSGDAFTLLEGEDKLTDYQFAKGHIHHRFCSICGTRSFSSGSGPKGEMIAVNVRCLDGVDVSSFAVKEFDGASL